MYEELSRAKAALVGAVPVEIIGEHVPTDEGTLGKTYDPVRMYLCEMGSIPLLTPDGQVALAKRIEHGQLRVLKTISRAPLILKEFLQVSKDLRTGSRSIKEIVQFDDEDLTEEKIEAKTKETLKQIDKVAQLYLVAMKQAQKLDRIPCSKKRPYLHARYALGRTRVEMSKCLRKLDFSPLEKKHLIDKIRQAAERVHFVEQEIRKLERRIEVVERRRRVQSPQRLEGMAARTRTKLKPRARSASPS